MQGGQEADFRDPCRDNFLTAAGSAGLSLPVVPVPVNLFQNSRALPDGSLAIGVAASRPGDTISFVAERSMVVVLTACAVDYPPLNSGTCGPSRIEVRP